jgi:NAD(P)-dependent dehydrogenase (short-subunit alcohol dehydrogenase family)
MANVIVVIGAGSIGQAIVRRVSAGKHVLLADIRQENAEAAAKTLTDAGFSVTTATVDVCSRDSVHALVEAATEIGDVFGVIHAAGISPSQASPETILKVDLYGTALVLEEFGNVIARGGSGIVIASQSGHRLPPLSAEQNAILATTPVEELLAHAAAGSDTRFTARLSDFEARELAAGDGRGGSLGKTRGPGEHDQPWDHHYSTGER